MGNLSERTFWIRTANPADSEAVTALLAASYSTLLSAAYESDLLGRGLSHFAKANRTLLACGTYYVAEREPAILSVAEAGPQRSQEPEMSMKGKRTFVILQCIQIGLGKELAAPFLLIASVMPGHSGYGN